MIDPETGEKLVTLEEAASLARLPEDVLMQYAIATSDWGEYSLTLRFGPGGPWFDPGECEGLGYILDGCDAEEFADRPPPPPNPMAFRARPNLTLRN